MSASLVSFGSFEASPIRVPDRVFQHISSFFQNSDWAHIMAVCKDWKEKGRIHFKATFGSALGLQEPYDLKDINGVMLQLFKYKKESDSFFQNREQIKTESSFVCLQFNVTSNGFNARSRLYRLNLISSEELKEFALKCKVWNVWMPLKCAQIFVSDRKLDFAKELLKQSNYYGDEFSQLVLNIISLECEANKLEDAFATLKEFQGIIYPHFVPDCVNLILKHAYEKNNESVIEKIIDATVSKTEKFLKVVNFIENCLNKGDYNKGLNLLNKFQLLFNDEKLKQSQINQFLKIYVRLNETGRAFELAKANQVMCPNSLTELKNIFIQMHNNEQAAKVQRLIEEIAEKKEHATGN